MMHTGLLVAEEEEEEEEEEEAAAVVGIIDGPNEAWGCVFYRKPQFFLIIIINRLYIRLKGFLIFPNLASDINNCSLNTNFIQFVPTPILKLLQMEQRSSFYSISALL